MDITLHRNGPVPFFACDDPAWGGCVHGFSTRLGGVSPAPWDNLNLGAGRGDEPAHVAENFRRFCAAVGADSAALVKNHQVHSDRIDLIHDRLVKPHGHRSFLSVGLSYPIPPLRARETCASSGASRPPWASGLFFQRRPRNKVTKGARCGKILTS